jgi:hypothetical protein
MYSPCIPSLGARPCALMTKRRHPRLIFASIHNLSPIIPCPPSHNQLFLYLWHSAPPILSIFASVWNCEDKLCAVADTILTKMGNALADDSGRVIGYICGRVADVFRWRHHKMTSNQKRSAERRPNLNQLYHCPTCEQPNSLI